MPSNVKMLKKFYPTTFCARTSTRFSSLIDCVRAEQVVFEFMISCCMTVTFANSCEVRLQKQVFIWSSRVVLNWYANWIESIYFSCEVIVAAIRIVLFYRSYWTRKGLVLCYFVFRSHLFCASQKWIRIFACVSDWFE